MKPYVLQMARSSVCLKSVACNHHLKLKGNPCPFDAIFIFLLTIDSPLQDPKTIAIPPDRHDEKPYFRADTRQSILGPELEIKGTIDATILVFGPYFTVYILLTCFKN